MKELESVLTHHIERAIVAAGRKFDSDCHGEMHGCFEAAEARVARLERQLQDALNQINHLNRHLETGSDRV
jgi:hypothetical protein